MLQKIKSAKRPLEISAALLTAAILSLPSKILADVSVPSVKVPTDLDVDEMLGKIRNYFFGIVIAACVFMILWGAFDIATAGDNENKLKGGKDRIKYALIGLLIAAMASVIVGIVMSIAKVDVP